MSISDELTVRIGEDTDINVLARFNVALAWETEHKELPLPVVTRGVQTLLRNPQYGFYVVAEHANTVVGSLMVTFEWSDWRCGLFWWIQSVYVYPESRRRGVFGRLFEFVEERASCEPDVCGLRVYVEQSNRAAQSTYTKVGMKETPYSKVYEKMLV
ncbi:MAG: GNAT family N-acetyltransferase [Phycisphaerales bacterium]|nr:MAG: GNAT family N-acetyltransferase [Phycisphaerales bacterium]